VATEILWCKITQLGVLQFEGAEAPSFLQAQLTNDVASLDAAHSQYAGYCTPKGRLLAVMLLWMRDGVYSMMLPRELCEPVRKRLSMYILRAKVKASDVSSQQTLFGLSGSAAEAMAVTVAGTAPAAEYEAVHGNGVSVFKLPRERYLIAATLSQAGAIETRLAAAAAGSAETLWAAFDIAAGIPNVYLATQEQFVPQAVNFDLIGALSFNKGCYPGQEIVARTHYLGRVKQRMVRGRLQSDQTPAPGDKLFSEPYGEQASGMIVNALRMPAGNHEVLAVVQSDNIAKGAVHWQTSNGPQLEILPLPYPVI
jgi:tRNA-modifying protein YgfZ